MKAKTSTGAFRHYLNRCFFKLELLRHLLNSMTLISAVWRNLKRRFGSWNCWKIMKVETQTGAF